MAVRAGALLVPGSLLLLAVLAWARAGGPPPDPEEQFQRAEQALRERFEGWRRRVEAASARLADLAREEGTGSVSLFRRAEEIRAQEGVDGVAVVDWENHARCWAGRTFEADPKVDFRDVEDGVEDDGVLDQPARRVLYSARPAGGGIAVAFLAFDERFPRRDDLAGKIAEETGLAQVRLGFERSRVALAGPGERSVVIDELVHATFVAPGEAERAAAAARARERRRNVLLFLGAALAAWVLGWRLGPRLPPASLARPLLAIALLFALRALLSTLRLPDLPLFHVPSSVHPLWAGPGDTALTALALFLGATWLHRAAHVHRGRRAALALALLGIGACHFLPGLYRGLVEALAQRDDDVLLFDPLRVTPDLPAALLLASLCLLTLALFLFARTAWQWARRAHPLLSPLPFLALASGLLPFHGPWLAGGALLAAWSLGRGTSRAEKGAALAFLAALASFPLLYAEEREGFVRDVAARARELASNAEGYEVARRLEEAVNRATDPEEGVDRLVAVALAEGDETKHLAFLLWSASRWGPGNPCAVQVWDLGGHLVSSFDFDSPPAAWLPAGPPAGPLASGLPGANGRIHFRVRDFVLRTIGDERDVGVARFLVPDRWDVLLSPLRPSMFTEPLDLLVRTAPPPLLMARLDAEGDPKETSAGAASELARPDPALLSRARRRGHASATVPYAGRDARLVLAPAGEGFAALVFSENDLEQGGFAFSKVLLTYSGVCLLYALGLLLRHGRKAPLLFRHRVSLFLVVLSVPPVLLLAVYNTRVSDQRYEREIRERLLRRLDTAETLLRRSDAPVDNDWCTSFAADHRMDLNVYRGQDLVATSRPGVWDTGLLARRLAAPPYVELELGKRSELVGREDFAHAADLRAAYRRIERDGGALILAAPALDDRRALERLAAEGNSLLLAIFLLAATVTVFGGLFLSRSLTRPLHALRQATRRVAAGELDASLREGRRDEFGDLIRAFNQMTIELREAQDLRVRAEKAAAWREMARQIAHDIKNPLTPIKLTIQNLLAAHRTSPAAFEQEFEKGAELILEHIDALHRIAGDFSAYARLPARRLEPVPLGPLMEEVAALYAASGGAAVRTDAPREPLPVRGDRDELRRALINLVANARQAGSRTVVLRARPEDGLVRLDVVDDGTGIAPEALARIFEPSFTTKTSGTGLGLPIVKRIVDDHGGTIAIATEPGRGTTVTVRLPAA